MYRTTQLVWACIADSACAVSRVEPMSVPLVYKANPKSAGQLGKFSCGGVSQVQVTDTRTEDATTLNLAESPGFGTALCHCESSASAQP